jgi:hypothetical protein
VFSLEWISRLPVIELGSIPFNQGKLAAIVFGVAAGAILTGTCLLDKKSMCASPSRYPGGNFCVAVKTPESRFTASELMAGIALRSTVKTLVCLRKRAW